MNSFTALAGRILGFAGNRVAKNTCIYFGGNVAVSLVPIVLAPVFTYYLSPRDFGMVGTGLVVVEVVMLFQGINAYGLIYRNYFDDAREAMRGTISTFLPIICVASTIYLVLAFLGGGALERWFQFPASWLPALVAVGALAAVAQIYLTILQAAERPLATIGLQAARMIAQSGTAVVLVILAGMDWRGRIVALLAGAGVACAIAFWKLVRGKYLSGKLVKWANVVSIVAFGLPLVPHRLGGLVMVMAPRLFLAQMVSVAETGIFTFAYTASTPIIFAMGSLNQAAMPVLFRKLKDGHEADKVRICRFVLLGMAVLPLVGAGYGLVIGWLLELVSSDRFHGSAEHVLWLSLAASLQGVYSLFASFVIYSKKTGLLAWRSDFLGGLAVLVFCPLLIREAGVIGASLAVAMGFLVSAIGCVTAAVKAVDMPWSRVLLRKPTAG